MTRAKYLADDDRGQPEEISSVLGSLVERVMTSVDIRHGPLVEDWLDVVPDDWTLGTPVGVRDGSLLVTVPDGATASLLRYQTGPLLRVIEERYGAGVVSDVRLRVARSRPTDIARE